LFDVAAAIIDLIIVCVAISTTLVTPADCSFAMLVFATSSKPAVFDASYDTSAAAALTLFFFNCVFSKSTSTPACGVTNPKTRVLPCRLESPAYWALPPDKVDRKLGTKYNEAVLSLCVAQRYGACFCRSAWLSDVAAPPFTMIFALAISDSNTGAPRPWSYASMTMNGFLAITASASARCAASSEPEASTNSYTGCRPHVW